MSGEDASWRTASRFWPYWPHLSSGRSCSWLLHADPVKGFSRLLSGAFGSWGALTETALKATPLLFVGVGITIAFRANVINIGGEGQMVAGALLATIVALYMPDVPAVIMLPTVLIAGIVGGAAGERSPGR